LDYCTCKNENSVPFTPVSGAVFCISSIFEDKNLNIFRAAIVFCAIGFSAAPIHALAATVQTEQKRAQLIEYSKDTDLKALSAQGKTVVFFFATWCPNCIMTLTELSEKWSDVNPDLILVIADYDAETALKAEYGVTYQDTFVLLTPEATVKKRWNAGGVAGLNKNTADK
jgi:thiol-disulfide isomerase/thioredoxin